MAVFVAGIDTEIGKTVVSSWLSLALSGAYWKPVQSGMLDHTDADEVRRLTGGRIEIYPSAYRFPDPISPHAAAAKVQTKIELSQVIRPRLSDEKTPLIIEPAGGILSPLNEVDRMIDLIHKTDKVLIVSKNYLGSINHTLLTYEVLIQRGLSVVGIVFTGARNPTTETLILKSADVPCLGRLPTFSPLDFSTVYPYAMQAAPLLRQIFTPQH